MYISYLHCQHIQVGSILCTFHIYTVNIFKWAVYYVHLILALSKGSASILILGWLQCITVSYSVALQSLTHLVIHYHNE